MSELSFSQQEAVLMGEPIEVCGLNLYPLTMRNYREWQSAKSVLLLRQTRLGVEYISLPFLAALYAVDYDAAKACGASAGLLAQICRLLALALRIQVTEKSFKIIVDPKDERRLKSISVQYGESLINITPSMFTRLRPIIAGQNGETLPDEADNLELVDAETDVAEARARKEMQLKEDFFALLSSVAYQYRIAPKEILDWTICEFRGAVDAIERDKMFTICALAEKAGGAKFKTGNPYPSWRFDKAEGESSALIPLSGFAAEMGRGAKML